MFLGLMLVAASSSAFADAKKKTGQTHASAINNQVSIRHLRLTLRARQIMAINH
jgi:hypothetical protein